MIRHILLDEIGAVKNLYRPVFESLLDLLGLRRGTVRNNEYVERECDTGNDLEIMLFQAFLEFLVTEASEADGTRRS